MRGVTEGLQERGFGLEELLPPLPDALAEVAADDLDDPLAPRITDLHGSGADDADLRHASSLMPMKRRYSSFTVGRVETAMSCQNV